MALNSVVQSAVLMNLQDGPNEIQIYQIAAPANFKPLSFHYAQTFKQQFCIPVWVLCIECVKRYYNLMKT